ncbi:solute carrier family 2, facilitated glucose transporter member 11-like [Hemicordylus capensis]|uniref:solute carrier family 2, facilitated glucose transporter member 11-like n=1 Tax=Hemicordylus capensis TaxID=884348 RepID=UPI002304AD5E|nr:solute carrier family 2, facilitated glucose transporter member 11-like [Hemicordylus capensis]
MEGLMLSDLVRYRKLFQLLLVLGVGGTFPIGYQISVVSYPSAYIKQFMNETWLQRSGSPLSEKTLLFLWSLIVSIYGIGGLFGCLASGYLTVRYGKKNSLLGTDLLIITTAFLVGFSRVAKSFEMILIGRFLYGVSAGFCMTIHPQYAGEASPKRLRGLANATAGFFWSLGKSVGQILGLREFLGMDSSWPCLLAFIGAPSLLQLLTLPFFPESPSYLLIQKGDEGGCLKAMQQLWGQEDPQEELCDLKKELAARQSGRVLGARDLAGDPSLRRQLHVLVVVVVMLQLCGINAVYFYTSEVFRTAGFAEGLIPYLSLGLGFCELFASLLCILSIERFGRRTLLWKGCGLMALVLLLLTVTLSLQNRYPWMSHGSVALIFLFVIFFGIGPSGATMSVMMEIFHHSARPAAFLLGGCLNWAGLFLIGITFPFIVECLGAFSFLLFMVVLVGSGIFFYLFLPETKGKSIVEITEAFNTPPFGKPFAAVLRHGFHEECSAYTSF